MTYIINNNYNHIALAEDCECDPKEPMDVAVMFAEYFAKNNNLPPCDYAYWRGDDTFYLSWRASADAMKHCFPDHLFQAPPGRHLAEITVEIHFPSKSFVVNSVFGDNAYAHWSTEISGPSYSFEELGLY